MLGRGDGLRAKWTAVALLVLAAGPAWADAMNEILVGIGSERGILRAVPSEADSTVDYILAQARVQWVMANRRGEAVCDIVTGGREVVVRLDLLTGESKELDLPVGLVGLTGLVRRE